MDGRVDGRKDRGKSRGAERHAEKDSHVGMQLLEQEADLSALSRGSV
jgi:hypothetical protein